MATPIASGAGFRRATVFDLSSAHLNLPNPPAASSATPKEYTRIVLSKSYSPAFPDPQIISHTGDDGLGGQILLPPNEPITGDLTAGTTNLTVDALLQGINVVSVGDMNVIGRGQKPQGFAQVGFLFYRQAIDTDPDSATLGADQFIWTAIPKCKVNPQGSPYEEGGDNVVTYNLLPQFTNRHLWGMSFVLGTEGFTSSQLIEGISNGPPIFNSWLLAALTTSYNLSESARADEAGTSFAIKVYLLDMSAGDVIDITAQCTLSATAIDTSGVSTPVIADDDVMYAIFEGTQLW